MVERPGLSWEKALVGGPAVYLLPDFFQDLDHVAVGRSYPGVLQLVNPLATKTTTGCPRGCGFCGVSTIEPGFVELEDWPDLPHVTDSNLLASTEEHFDRVMDRLERHVEVDFNQGLDARLLTGHHVERLARLKRPKLRMAVDSSDVTGHWAKAYEALRSAGVAKSNIKSLCLVGFVDSPEEAWERTRFVRSFGIDPSPMWYHALDAMEWNGISARQRQLGWTHQERKRLFQWWYWRKETQAGKTTKSHKMSAGREDLFSVMGKST